MHRTRITLAALALALPSAAFAQGAPAATSAAPRIERTERLASGGLYEVAFNPVDKRVYVAATGPRGANAAKVVVLDGTTLQRVGEIDVSQAALFGLGLDSRAQILYGTATREGSVAIIDLKSGAVTNVKPEGSERAHLREVIADEATGKAYASVMVGSERADPAAPAQPQQIWVIDGKAKKVERVLSVDTKNLTGLALDARGGRLFGTGMGANEVVVVNIKSGSVTRWPSGGEAPINLAYDEAGKRLFVANQKSGDLTVLDANTGAQKAKVPTGAGALSVAFNPAKQQVYVANRQAGTLSVIDARSYRPLASLPTGTFPQTIALDRASGAVYVTNKARGLPRNAPAGTPPVEDTNGDTVTLVRP